MEPTTELTVTENQTALAGNDVDFVNDVIENWISDADVNELTQKSYRTAARKFVDFLTSNRITLSEETLKGWRKHLTETRAASTARLYFTVTKTFVSWLAKRGYCRYDFGNGVKNVPLSTDTHSRDALTVAEAAKVLNSFHSSNLKDLRDKTMLALMITTGVRTVTIVNLNVGDIRRKNGRWVLLCKVKARAEKVTVNLPDETKKLIDAYLKARGGGKLSPSEPLFTSTSRRNYGQKITTQAVSRVAKKAFRICGLDSAGLVAHSCRHAFATISLMQGVSLDETSKALHHRSVTVTENYRHDIEVANNTATRVVAAAVFKEMLKETKKGGKKNG